MGPGNGVEQNRLDLHNGGDVFLILNEPYLVGDPENGDFDGDMFYKIYPGSTLQRCSGVAELVAHSYSVFDGDWGNDSTFPCMTIDRAYSNSAGEISADPYDGVTVLLPQIVGTGLFPPPCPPPGMLSGYEIREEFINMGTGLPEPLLLDADDPDDHWAFSSYFVGWNATSSGSVTAPAVNSCGDMGDAVYTWHASTDAGGVYEGEQQPDWLGTQTSAYSGHQGGTNTASGVNAYVPDTPASGVATSWFFSEPTVQLNVRVDTDRDYILGPVGAGLAGLNPPINFLGGMPVGAGPSIGFLHEDGAAHTVTGAGYTNPISVGFANIGATLLDFGIGCVPFMGGQLALNPADPFFVVLTIPWGFNGFVDHTYPGVPERDEATSTSALVPIVPGNFVGVQIKVQTFTYDDASAGFVGSSQVTRFTFR